jgi:hypothetical protein
MKFKTEYYWIFGTGILTHLIWRSILGDLTYNGRPLEIQDHDTYFIVPKLLLVALTFLVILFFMYLLRWVHKRTINKWSIMVILSLTTVMFVFLFFNWLTSLETIQTLGRTLYSETKETDRVQMTLISHATLTFAVGMGALLPSQWDTNWYCRKATKCTNAQHRICIRRQCSIISS